MAKIHQIIRRQITLPSLSTVKLYKSYVCSQSAGKTIAFGSVLIFTVTLLFLITHSEHLYSDFLLNSLNGPLKYDDPELIQYIKEKILEPPSNEAYNIQFRWEFIFKSQIFYRNFTKVVFSTKRNGFFVEAGALDGVSMSNSLSLEMNQGWTGLLVEPDPSNYIALKRKNRKSWTAKVCLSVDSYPKQEKLTSFDVIKDIHRYTDIKNRAMGSILRQGGNNTFSTKSLTNDMTTNSYYTGQCVPLESLLLAMNATKVDLLSLDVEFVEEQVIRHFPFDKFDVQVIFMEWWDHGKLSWLNDFLQSNGYRVVNNKAGDIIFVKRDSEAAKIVDSKKLWKDLKYFH